MLLMTKEKNMNKTECNPWVTQNKIFLFVLIDVFTSAFIDISSFVVVFKIRI